jgi:hypothetical protein
LNQNCQFFSHFFVENISKFATSVPGALNTTLELEPDRLDAAGITVDDGKWFDPVKATFAGHTGRVLDVRVIFSYPDQRDRSLYF